MNVCTRNVNRVSEIAQLLLMIAQGCIADCEHDECLVLHGILLDAAYTVLSAAERCRRELDERAIAEKHSYSRQREPGFRNVEARAYTLPR